MKRAALRLSFVIFLLAVAGCSGGGSSMNASTGTTTVTINLGQTKTVSSAGGTVRAAASIPDAVARIRITVSAPDIPTIERMVELTGTSSTISEKFDVLNGRNRLFTVEGLDKDGYVLYRGEVYADLSGSPVNLSVTMVSSDPLPPAFQGLSSISQITTTSLVLSWQAATDEVTLPDKIQYLIYMSTTPGGENYGAPTFTTAPGATSFNVTGLNPGTKYYFVVRSMDEMGNVGINYVEFGASTSAEADVSPPNFEGLSSAVAASTSTIDLAWNAASDNISPQPSIVYLVYMSATPGGENFASPTFETAPGAISYQVGGLSPNTNYCFVVRSRDEAGNVDGNVVERCAITLSPPDVTPPVFGGLVSAAVSGTTVLLKWSPASDSGGVAGYNVYMATASGGENFASPVAVAAANATSINIVPPRGGATYYFVVRALDTSGNTDANKIERYATTDMYVRIVSGSNVSGCGAPNNACKTIGYGLSQITATLPVKIIAGAGTYDVAAGETFPINFGGTNGISLQCAPWPGGTVISPAGGPAATAIFGGNNFRMDNCEIRQPFGRVAAFFDNAPVPTPRTASMTINNCLFDGLSKGLNGVELGSNSVLSNSTIRNFTQFGVVLSGGNPRITGNTITGNGEGVQIWNDAGGLSITGNSIFNNRAGIGISAGNPKINNNRLYCNVLNDNLIIGPSVSVSIDARYNSWDNNPPWINVPGTPCQSYYDVCYNPLTPAITPAPNLSGATQDPNHCWVP